MSFETSENPPPEISKKDIRPNLKPIEVQDTPVPDSKSSTETCEWRGRMGMGLPDSKDAGGGRQIYILPGTKFKRIQK